MVRPKTDGGGGSALGSPAPNPFASDLSAGPGGGGSGALGIILNAQNGSPGGLGSGQFVDPTDPMVWMGNYESARNPFAGKALPDGGRVAGIKPTRQQLPAIPSSQAKLSIRNWPLDEQKKLARRLWALGYPQVGSPDDVFGAITVWELAVDEAAKSQAAGSSITPDGVIDLYAAKFPDERNKRSQNQAGIHVQKSRRILLSDPTHARALIEEAFQNAYGRDPTDAEIRTLTRTLNATEQAHPIETTVTSQTDAAGNVIGVPTSVESGGINPQEYLAQTAAADPEAAQHQAAANYFPLLMKMLGVQS